jgi:hypothetical protein
MSRNKKYEERVKDFSRGILAFMAIVFLTMILSASAVQALPDIELNTSMNKQNFYTLPIFVSEVIEHFVNTTSNGTQIDTNVDIDFVRGMATSKWWNATHSYKTPIVMSLPSTFNSNYTIVVSLDVQEMISEGKLRNDLRNLVLVENDKVIDYKLGDYDTSTAQVMFKLDNNTRTRYIDLYYGSASIMSMNESSVYRFYEDFSEISEWNVTSGIFNVSNSLVSQEANISKIQLINLSSESGLTSMTEKMPFIMEYEMTLTQNSSLTLIMSDNHTLESKVTNITFTTFTDNQTICIDSSCTIISRNISTALTHLVKVNVTSSNIQFVFDNEVFAQRSHSMDEIYLGFIVHELSIQIV